jgi:hypothetical protein
VKSHDALAHMISIALTTHSTQLAPITCCIS